jgi:integrase
MPKMRLTDAAVQRIKAPPGQRVDYFDTLLGHGFALRVSGPTPRSPQGRKTWVVLYRFGGQLKRLTIEPDYPTLGLAAAREKAREALRALKDRGEDPAAAKARVKAAIRQPIPVRAPVKERGPDTIENVIDEFMRRYMQARKRAPRYIEETRRNFDKHVLPHWRGQLLGSITRRDVIALLDAIADEGKPIAANRVRAALSKLFNWSIQRGIIDASPVAMVERPGAETERERALSDAEIRTVWQAAGKLAYPFGPFFKMALATAQRRSEVASIRWTDIDLDEQTWTLPAALTKANRAHIVPLSPVAMRILAECPRCGAHVFTTGRRRGAYAEAGDAPISGFSKAKTMLDANSSEIAEAGKGAPGAPWRLHDLRRTAATVMGRLRVPRFVLGRVLNHTDQSVTGIYDRHESLDEKRQALDAWGRFLENLTGTPGGTIVPLRREA